MRTFFSVILVALALLAPSAALAQSAPPTREQIVTMLSGFEDTPTLAQMRALGDGAVPILIALYDDPAVIQPVRLRAVEAMGAYASPEARTFLLRLIHERGASPILVREAIEALGQSQGASAIPVISPLLSSPTRAIRESAIEALGAIGTPAAHAQLTRRQPQEHDTALRARIVTLTTH